MPSREYYENEATNHNPLNIFRIIGQSNALTSGWPAFAFKTFTVSTGSAAIFGLATYMLLKGPLGPTLPLLGGAGFGFIGGLVHRWRTDRAEVRVVLDKYPEVLEFHLRLTDPKLNRELDAEDGGFAAWASQMNFTKESHLISALYSASDCLQKIHEAQEQQLLAKYTE